MRSMDCQHLSYSTDSKHHLSCEKTRSNLHCEKGEKGQVSVYSLPSKLLLITKNKILVLHYIFTASKYLTKGLKYLHITINLGFFCDVQ